MPKACDLGHGRIDLTVFDHFAECLAVGIFTDEAWFENVSRITRQSSHPAVRADGSATLIVEPHSLTVCDNRWECSLRPKAAYWAGSEGEIERHVTHGALKGGRAPVWV